MFAVNSDRLVRTESIKLFVVGCFVDLCVLESDDCSKMSTIILYRLSFDHNREGNEHTTTTTENNSNNNTTTATPRMTSYLA